MANNSSDPSPSQSPSSSSNAPKYGTRVPNRIFVGGIASSTTEYELHVLFSNYGNVRATKIIADRAGVSKGYGFVTFETEEEATRIQECDGIMLKDRKLNIAPAIRKQQQFSSYSRTCDSTTTTSSTPILYHNGVPYTYNNGMAYFATPDTSTFTQYGTQPQATYSMVYPSTVYVQPQQYQYQIPPPAAQQVWPANDWRLPANLGYGQNPSPVVTPQYVYAPSHVSSMGDQSVGPTNLLSVSNLQGNPHPSYNVSAAGGAGDHADLQTIENNSAESSAKHQNGKEPEHLRRADNHCQNTNPAILIGQMPMAASGVTVNNTSEVGRIAERRSGGARYKRNVEQQQDQYHGPGTRSNRKPFGTDKSSPRSGMLATAIVQPAPPNMVSYAGHTVFQPVHYMPGYLQYPPPYNTRFRGHNSTHSRYPVPRMYTSAGNGTSSYDGCASIGVGGVSSTPVTSRNGQGVPLTPPNTPMSPSNIAATDPAIIGSVCAIRTLSLN